MPFDPCREWLGIDATHLRDPHRVLAIPPHVTDGDTIARVAEERLANLAAIAPGPFAKAHAALMTRVAEARDTLLATATWDTAAAPPPEEPVYTLPPPPQASPPPPPAVHDLLADLFDDLPAPAPPSALPSPPTVDEPERPMVAPEPVTPAPMDDAQSHADAYESVYEDDHDHHHDVTSPTAAEYLPPLTASTRRSGGGGGLGLLAIFLAVALAAGYYAYKKLGVKERGWVVALRSLMEPQPESPPADLFPPRPPSDTPSLPVPTEPPQPSVTRPQDPSPTHDEPVDPTESRPQPPAPPRPPPPTQDPETEHRTSEERARMTQRVEASLRKAFDALMEEEFDAAGTSLAAAAQDAGDDLDIANRVERWRLLADYARGYSTFRARAFKSASSGREYEIDGKRIVVIEVTAKDFTYRFQGKNKTFSRKSMPPVLEVGLVEAWFGGDGRAANYLFLGARWLCKEKPNHERARAAWQKAADGGENVSPLLALLDDPIMQQPDEPY